MIGELPRALEVHGVFYAIRTDFRDVLTIISAFNDPELDNPEKLYICLVILFEDFDDIPEAGYEEAYKQAVWFIDGGAEPSEKRSPRTMDWEQDERLLFPAVNRVAGCEVRALEYLHWWTFLGYFMEIQEGTFSHILSLRQRKAKGKKLTKEEQEFWRQNKDLCVLRPKITKEEREQRDRLNALLGD